MALALCIHGVSGRAAVVCSSLTGCVRLYIVCKRYEGLGGGASADMCRSTVCGSICHARYLILRVHIQVSGVHERAGGFCQAVELSLHLFLLILRQLRLADIAAVRLSLAGPRPGRRLRPQPLQRAGHRLAGLHKL